MPSKSSIRSSNLTYIAPPASVCLQLAALAGQHISIAHCTITHQRVKSLPGSWNPTKTAICRISTIAPQQFSKNGFGAYSRIRGAQNKRFRICWPGSWIQAVKPLLFAMISYSPDPGSGHPNHSFSSKKPLLFAQTTPFRHDIALLL